METKKCLLEKHIRNIPKLSEEELEKLPPVYRDLYLFLVEVMKPTVTSRHNNGIRKEMIE